MGSEQQAFDVVAHALVEGQMVRLGIVWTIVCVDVGSVDIKDNLYQTRVNTNECVEKTCKEYADKMKGGDAFPMVVLQEKSPGRYRVVCGRHRARAYQIAQNGKTSYRAYVVSSDTGDNLLRALSARENNTNGVRQGSGDTARVAAEALCKAPVAKGGRCHRAEVIKQVSDQYAANQSTVRDHYHAALVSSHMLQVGVSPRGLPVSTSRRLWRWTDCHDWKQIAEAIAENATLSCLHEVVQLANKDRVDGKTLIKMIRDAADSDVGRRTRGGVFKDPATVTIEHLTLALEDIRVLAPPRNLQQEMSEEISDLVEAVRLAAKEWKLK
jgi:hypothetical protein